MTASTPLPVLGAKLLPPSPGPLHLRRERLHALLRRALEGRATAVVAGPGYGKSALVARFLQESGSDTVWYALDASDRSPAIFFRYLTQGLREHAPEFGERTEWIWKDARARLRKPEELADLFIGEAEQSLGGRFIVVLDQVEQLDGSPAAARALRRLLAYLPGTLHLVVIGRSLPDAGFKGLETDGLVAHLRGDDLLFTVEETEALLVDTFGLTVSADTVRRVQARTRGWVTALQLLRQTAALRQAAPDLPEEVFARTEADIFDYFTERVLEDESAETRDFLLGSSPPAVFDPDLLGEVLEGIDVRGVLQALVRRNLFVSPLESRGAHFAYDPLFRDYLVRRLRAERGAEARRDLERHYSRAFARRREFPQALQHGLAAEDAKGVADLLARQGKPLLRAGFVEPSATGAAFSRPAERPRPWWTICWARRAGCRATSPPPSRISSAPSPSRHRERRPAARPTARSTLSAERRWRARCRAWRTPSWRREPWSARQRPPSGRCARRATAIRRWSRARSTRWRWCATAASGTRRRCAAGRRRWHMPARRGTST